MNILVVGGAGYIGSHTVAHLLQDGHSVTVLDNFSNSDEGVIEKLKSNFGDFDVIKSDLRDYTLLRKSLKGVTADAVIHFAALIEVGRSVNEASNFFDNNVNGSQNLFRALENIGIKKVIFSSSAAVYGPPKHTPISETADLNAGNPYATSKIVVEKILEDYCKYSGFKGISLRYFNPAGSLDGIIGEAHHSESHLIPRLLRSIKNQDDKFTVYGDDYSTSDGSAIRDYIHIMDLVDIHIKAINYLDKIDKYNVFNVGTGKGHSVFEVIKTAEKITGKKLKYSIVPRRDGDSPILIADIKKIKEKIDWSSKYDLPEIVDSAWKWAQGYNN